MRRTNLPPFIFPKFQSGPKDKNGNKVRKERELMENFALHIKEINKDMEFPVSSRGWAYVLEEFKLIGKRQFDEAESKVNDCRKMGLLPINICGEAAGRPSIDVFGKHNTEIDVEDVVEDVLDFDSNIKLWVSWWQPIHPIEYRNTYLELAVEKIDLLNLWADLCKKYKVQPTNFGGQSDLNNRAAIANRMHRWHLEGKRCVLLYAGDHDPDGLAISANISKLLADIEAPLGFSTDFIEVHRFGLNEDWIKEHNLSWIEGLQTSGKLNLEDPRHRNHKQPYVQDYLAKYGARKVEANALVVRMEAGRKLLEDTILTFIDYDTEIGAYNREIQRLRTEKITEIKAALTDELNDRM